jgi:Cu+-exporting ATPase
VIVTLVLLGQVLELRARSRTNAAIRELLALAPAVATRVAANGDHERVALDAIRVGDRLIVRPIAAGALYPVFGVVLSPMFAAAAMSASSVSVIGNALRLRTLSLEG